MSATRAYWRRWIALVGLGSVLVLAGGCKEREPSPPPHDSARVRRVFRPPDQVRPAPPHVIHAQGVGPYEFGLPLGDILDLSSRGPRVVLTRIDGVINYNVARVDGNAVVIGVTRARGVVFVSVLEDWIARTEAGVGVGTELGHLRDAMGAPLAHDFLAMDPRLVAFDSLPGARFVLNGARGVARKVAAVNIRPHDSPRRELLEPAKLPAAAEPPRPGKPPKPTNDDTTIPARDRARQPCPEIEATAERDRRLRTLAYLASSRVDTSAVVYGCFSEHAWALVVDRSDLAVVGGEPEDPRILARYERDGIEFAAPLDVDGDHMHEIALVYQNKREQERSWHLEILHCCEQDLQVQSLADQELYRLSARSAALVAASLNEIELLLELWASDDERVSVTGLYVQSEDGRPSNVVLLLPVDVPMRRKRVRTDSASLPASDSGVDDRADSGVPRKPGDASALRDAGAAKVNPVGPVGPGVRDASSGPQRETSAGAGAIDHPRTPTRDEPKAADPTGSNSSSPGAGHDG